MLDLEKYVSKRVNIICKDKTQTGYPFPSPTKGAIFQMSKRDRTRVGNPPGVKGLRPLKSHVFSAHELA